MTAAEAAAKTAAPYIVGAGLLAFGGYWLYTKLPDAKDAAEAVKDAAFKIIADERDSSSELVESTIQNRMDELNVLPAYDVGVPITYKEDGTPDMKQFVEDVGGIGELGYTLGTFLYPDSVIVALTDAAIDSKIEAESSPTYKAMIEKSYDTFGATNPVMGIDTINRALTLDSNIPTYMQVTGDIYDYYSDKLSSGWFS